MRRNARLLLAAALAVSAALPVALPSGSARAQARPPHAQAPRAQPQQAQPPHAWLFGTWTGGLFPVLGTPTAQTCQPVVVFTRDVVMRATLLDPTPIQRVIETVRAAPTGVEFRFVAAGPTPAPTGVLDLAPPPTAGFGCADPDTLVVQRRGAHEIAFPGCEDFPNPLVRCPER